ncbi:MAG TPA: AgmX/PglI C-terminal domain-containing protein [Steroidobacteraceae bacterium]|nr:AgmX/PglI C-terminal domain-containing protein [Steroidobacteraceae bacterium]
MSTVAAHFRDFDLPWTLTYPEERRFRRMLGAALGLFVGFGIVIPFLPVTPPSQVVPPAVPERVLEYILEQPRPKPTPTPKSEAPPAPEPVEVSKPEAKVPQAEPLPRPEPARDPRARAAASGLVAMADQLAELRNLDVTSDVPAQTVDTGATQRSSVDRSILTARARTGSGGIAVGAASRGFGGGAVGLKGVSTATVVSGTASEAGAAPEAQRTGRSAKAARTREEIELVFDKNKSAIYALYSRALRENPALQGKVVLEVTIAPSGEVTDCKVLSSDLADAELERKLVARVRMFRFEARDVAVMTTTKPIEFFPA